MQETESVDTQSQMPVSPVAARAPMPVATVLSFVVGLVGIAALGASAWVYTETQREIVRLSTDMAQLRVSMELFARQQGAISGTDGESLADLSNRLSILEESWRDAPATATAAPPAASGNATANTAASEGDCLPSGTRVLMAAGDSYPICGIAGEVSIGAVDNGFISLADGTVIAAGGNIALAGTGCMIGVVSAGDVTGFAEIRVTC